MKKVIAVVGPTASGKSALAVAIAKQVGGEVVSADSMQIYRDMPVANAVATEEEQQGIKHHLIEFLPLGETYSVARFVDDAKRVIDDIVGRGKIPVVAGGTGLFIDSLFKNISFVNSGKTQEIRQKLFERAEKEGNMALYDELKKIDPAAAEKIHPNNVNRVVRALELFYSTGIKISEQVEMSTATPSDIDVFYVGINYADRQALYDRINKRVDLMMENGLEEEARRVLSSSLSETSKQAIGHKELAQYINGSVTKQEAVEKLKMETRRYAKRQITWFKRNKEIHWFFPDEDEAFQEHAIQAVENFLKG